MDLFYYLKKSARKQNAEFYSTADDGYWEYPIKDH